MVYAILILIAVVCALGCLVWRVCFLALLLYMQGKCEIPSKGELKEYIEEAWDRTLRLKKG